MTESRPDLHDGFRELISARMDAPLELEFDGDLAAHLLGCGRCRQFEHDLLEQRHLLRSLPTPLPPRELWARTSAAIDRELLRDAARGSAAGGQPRASGRIAELTNPASVPSVLMVSTASLALAVVLLITQLGPALRLPSGGTGGEPTPAAVAGVALAFVGADEGGLTLYRTRVDGTCADSPSCAQEPDAVAARVSFPASFEPNNLALAPRGDRLAIIGSDSERENVIAVVVVPQLEPDDGSDFPTRPRFPARPNTGPPATTEAGETVLVVESPSPSSPSGTSGPAAPPTELPLSTILDGVHTVGSSAAWSADGAALAFSAMPADLGRGPDIYVWRVGDDRAKPITSDHSSYFASWSGDVIVVSRVVPSSIPLVQGPSVETVAIDPSTARERIVDAGGLWLPQVDPRRHRAVAWHGSLAWDGAKVVPTVGGLYLLDWANVDPFAPTGPPTPDGGDVDVAARRTPGSPQASATSAATPSAAPTSPTPAPPVIRAPIVSDAPTAPSLNWLTPIEPSRDVRRHAVIDWRVMWSADGRTLGVWVGEEPSTTWGELTVLSVDLHGRLDRDNPLLGPTLAKRGFNLGASRVAWVAPVARTAELRVRTWGDSGVRDVRVRLVASAGVVAAF